MIGLQKFLKGDPDYQDEIKEAHLFSPYRK